MDTSISDLTPIGVPKKMTARNGDPDVETEYGYSRRTVPAHAASLTHPKYRADIDGLRAIAVLSVVGFHAFPKWVAGGYIGVDIFFVISGFLISTIIFGNLTAGTFSFIEFYSRRVRRIFQHCCCY